MRNRPAADVLLPDLVRWAGVLLGLLLIGAALVAWWRSGDSPESLAGLVPLALFVPVAGAAARITGGRCRAWRSSADRRCPQRPVNTLLPGRCYRHTGPTLPDLVSWTALVLAAVTTLALVASAWRALDGV